MCIYIYIHTRTHTYTDGTTIHPASCWFTSLPARPAVTSEEENEELKDRLANWFLTVPWARNNCQMLCRHVVHPIDVRMTCWTTLISCETRMIDKYDNFRDE